MRKALSPKQRQVFDFVANYIRESGYPPSLDEIANGLRLSHSTANSHLTAMLKKGWLIRREHIPRSLRLIMDEPEMAPETAPLAGAGQKGASIV